MDHFLKRFTIIDFLSMFVPGGITILALNYYMGGVLEPFQRFFGEQDLALAAYFILISYLTGMVLQELSKFLEGRWATDLNAVHEKWQRMSNIKLYYLAHFGFTIGEERRREGGIGDVGRNIFLYVSDPGIAGSKLSLFQAFYSMARNSVATAVLICIMSILHTVQLSFVLSSTQSMGENIPISVTIQPCTTLGSDLMVCLVSIIVAYIMHGRSRRFYLLTQERAYRDFLKLAEQPTDSQTT